MTSVASIINNIKRKITKAKNIDKNRDDRRFTEIRQKDQVIY
jgi:hypothetical protein